MIVDELAYKVTLRAEEFLTGKKKVQEAAEALEKAAVALKESVSDSMDGVGRSSRKAGDEVERTTRRTNRNLKNSGGDFKQFQNSAVRAFNGAGKAMAGFLGVGVGLYGLKQLFGSTATEITRASNAAKFFGSDVNRVFGLQRGFKQAGLNGDAFIGAAGSARMALANIADPTVMGGLTGQAQNLLTLGARTGLNVNELGDPTKALAEFTRYGKTHDQSNLMQVMSAAGFDPSDAAKIKSGDLKQLVDSETKKSNITQEQIKQQEAVVQKMGALAGQVDRLKQSLAMTFAPEVISGMERFGKWMETHSGDVVGAFEAAGRVIKTLTDNIGEANTLLLLLSVGLRRNPLVMGVLGVLSVAEWAESRAREAKEAGVDTGEILNYNKPPSLPGSIYTNNAPNPRENANASSDRFWNWVGGFFSDEPEQHAQSSRRNKPDRNNNPGNLRPVGGEGFRQFSTEEEGWEALTRQLGLYYTGRSAAAGHKKLQTLRDIISTYAPPTENNTEKYISTVAGWMGVQPEQRLNLENPAVMAKLRSSMARYEGATNWQRGISPEQVEQYKLQMQYANMPPPSMQSIDRSQSSSVHINTVEVKTNPATADALTESIKQRAARSLTNGAFASAVVG